MRSHTIKPRGKKKKTTITTKAGDFPRRRASSAQSLTAATICQRIQEVSIREAAMNEALYIFLPFVKIPNVGASWLEGG
jgi:hypothetical protein